MVKRYFILFLLIFHSFIDISILREFFGTSTAYTLTVFFSLLCFSFVIFNRFKLNRGARVEFFTFFAIFLLVLVKYIFISVHPSYLIILISNISLLYLVFSIQIIDYIDSLFRILIRLNVILILIYYLNIFNLGFLIWDDSLLADSLFFGLSRLVGIFGNGGYASLSYCIIFFYFLYLQIDPNKNKLVNYFYLLAALIFGLLTGNRSFILGTAIGFLIFLFTTFKISRIKSYVAFIFFFSITATLFINEISILFDYFVFRFESGFQNRLENETGILDLLKNINLKTILWGSLESNNSEFYVLINNIHFLPHNGLLYYLSAFGFSVFLLIVLLYSRVAAIIIKSKRFKKSLIYSIVLNNLIIMVFYSMGEAFLLTPLNIILIKYIIELSQTNNYYYESKSIVNS